MSRLKPKQRTTGWQISTYMASYRGQQMLHSTDVDMGDGVVYERRADRLRIHVGDADLVIAPGRRFAEALAKGFSTMTDLTTDAGQETTCPQCGQVVRVFTSVHGVQVPIDPKPHPNGVWVIVADDRVRLLQPMEEPTAPTYQEHYCREEKAR